MATRKCYDLSFKLKAVALAEKKSKEASAREFKVDSRRIREWCSQKEQLMELKKTGKSRRKRLTGAGRKPLDENMEDDLFHWIMELRRRNVRVSRKMIREKAKAVTTAEDTSFKASKGWLQLFLKRKNLSLRKRTTVSQKTPADVIPKLTSFIMHLRKLQMTCNFSLTNTYAMDETACWLEMPSETTIDVRGAKSVPLKTTGHEKDHYTVILSARADGKKLKPYIVF